MAIVDFSSEEKEVLVQKLKRYFSDELEQELGQFDAEFLLDYLSEHFGAFYYNKGLLDAQALLASKIDDLTDAFYELEKPTDF